MSAKLRLDDPPERLEPARRMIERGEKFREVRRHFARPNEAFGYYTTQLRVIHDSPPRAEFCCCVSCGKAVDLVTLEFAWRAIIRRAFDWIMIPFNALAPWGAVNAPYFRFHTYHPICEPCRHALRRRGCGWSALAGLGVVILGFASIPAMLGLILGYGGTWKPSERPQVILTGWIGLAAMVFGIAVVRFAMVRRAPRALRHIAAWPIQLESFHLMDWDESQPDWILLTERPLPVAKAIDGAYADDGGGVDIFLGTTRWENNDQGHDLLALDYEAYAEMALKQMHDLARNARERWPIKRLAILHRLGRVEVTQPSVAIVVACGHRAEAFEACRWIIDTLKKDVAIWKKEVWADGSGTWVHPEK